jgi:predicted glutamate--cysteine ligase
VRHLWTSVRPNGDNRPHDLNRLEIRICDLVSDPLQLLAITAYAELRLQQLLRQGDQHDPLRASQLTPAELAELADANDRAAARSSLDASLGHWRDGCSIEARQWIRGNLTAMAPLAAELGLAPLLAQLEPLLEQGNQAMDWLRRHAAGESVPAIVAADAAALAQREAALATLGTEAGAGLLG